MNQAVVPYGQRGPIYTLTEEDRRQATLLCKAKLEEGKEDRVWLTRSRETKHWRVFGLSDQRNAVIASPLILRNIQDTDLPFPIDSTKPSFSNPFGNAQNGGGNPLANPKPNAVNPFANPKPVVNPFGGNAGGGGGGLFVGNAQNGGGNPFVDPKLLVNPFAGYGHAQNGGGGLFGNSNAQNGGGGLFGGNGNAQNGGGGLFGNSNAQNDGGPLSTKYGGQNRYPKKAPLLKYKQMLVDQSQGSVLLVFPRQVFNGDILLDLTKKSSIMAIATVQLEQLDESVQPVDKHDSYIFGKAKECTLLVSALALSEETDSSCISSCYFGV